MSDLNNAPAAAFEEYDHINIMEIDPTFKPVPRAYYTLQINKITPKKVTPKSGKSAGQEVLVLNGSFTIVKDDNYSGRKLWQSFWASNGVDLKNLRLLANATGTAQTSGQTLSEFAMSFQSLNPPAEFKIFVDEEPEYRSGEPVNVLKFNTAQPA